MRKYILTLIFFGVCALPAAAQTVWDGVYSKEQADRGKELYLTTCTPCHGETLMGAEGGPPVTGEAFRTMWDGKTADLLVEKIRTTMPTDSPGFLSRAQSTDLTAYLFEDNGFPAGDADMPSSLTALKKIVIKGEK